MRKALWIPLCELSRNGKPTETGSSRVSAGAGGREGRHGAASGAGLPCEVVARLSCPSAEGAELCALERCVCSAWIMHLNEGVVNTQLKWSLVALLVPGPLRRRVRASWRVCGGSRLCARWAVPPGAWLHQSACPQPPPTAPSAARAPAPHSRQVVPGAESSGHSREGSQVGHCCSQCRWRGALSVDAARPPLHVSS